VYQHVSFTFLSSEHFEGNTFSSETLSIFVAGMFQDAVDEGHSVPESLRTSMLKMLQDDDKHIYHWAPLIVMGSPTLCIENRISKTKKRKKK
jgi:hypothetical protein